MAAMESSNCFIEATLIARDKSIIKEETNYSAYVVNRKALSVEFQRLAETAAERASGESPLVNQGGIAGLSKYCHAERNEDSSTR